MSNRSQLRKTATHGYRPVISNVLPDTATLAAAGAVGRTIATLSTTGGVAPITYSIAAAAGLAFNIVGALMVTTVNPAGTAGAKAVQITARDGIGQTKTETVTVTLT